MLSSLKDRPSVAAGHVTIDHSVGGARPHLKEVRYVLLSPHDPTEKDPLGLTALPEEVKEQLNHDSDLLRAYLNSERDAGINELRQEILRRCNGGLSLSVEFNRGICNAGRDTGEKALPNIWDPEKRALVRPLLLDAHQQILEDINRIVDGVRRGTRILFLHSMDPWSFKTGVRPPLTPETLSQYVAAQGLTPEHKSHRREDLITGKRGGAIHADSHLYGALQREFTRHQIPWAINQPYDTEEGNPDWTFMHLYPGRVSVVDLTKTRLCEGAFETFDPRNPKVDPERVAFMADLHRFAIEAATQN